MNAACGAPQVTYGAAPAQMSYLPPATAAAPAATYMPATNYAAPVQMQAATYAAPAPMTYAAPQAVTAFDAMDRNHDGVITRQEFMGGAQPNQPAQPSYMPAQASYLPAQTVQAPASATYATPASGYGVTAMQYQAQAAPVMQAPAMMGYQAAPQMMYGAPAGQDMTTNQLFNAIDTNHDGIISRAEMGQWRM